MPTPTPTQSHPLRRRPVQGAQVAGPGGAPRVRLVRARAQGGRRHRARPALPSLPQDRAPGPQVGAACAERLLSHSDCLLPGPLRWPAVGAERQACGAGRGTGLAPSASRAPPPPTASPPTRSPRALPRLLPASNPQVLQRAAGPGRHLQAGGRGAGAQVRGWRGAAGKLGRTWGWRAGEEGRLRAGGASQRRRRRPAGAAPSLPPDPWLATLCLHPSITAPQPQGEGLPDQRGHDGHLLLERAGCEAGRGGPRACVLEAAARAGVGRCSARCGRGHAGADSPELTCHPATPHTLPCCLGRGADGPAGHHRSRHLQLRDRAVGGEWGGGWGSCGARVWRAGAGGACRGGGHLPPGRTTSLRLVHALVHARPAAATPTPPPPSHRQVVTGEIPTRGTMRDPRVPEECPQVGALAGLGSGAGGCWPQQPASEHPRCASTAENKSPLPLHRPHRSLNPAGHCGPDRPLHLAGPVPAPHRQADCAADRGHGRRHAQPRRGAGGALPCRRGGAAWAWWGRCSGRLRARAADAAAQPLLPLARTHPAAGARRAAAHGQPGPLAQPAAAPGALRCGPLGHLPRLVFAPGRALGRLRAAVGRPCTCVPSCMRELTACPLTPRSTHRCPSTCPAPETRP